MKLSALFEQAKWAVGLNADKAELRSQHDQNDPRYTLLWIDIADLFKHTNPDQQIDLISATGEIKGRIPRAKHHWQAGRYMDPAIVGYNKWKGNFDFTDGRHRLVAAFQLGERVAPILVPTEQLNIFKQNLKIE